VAMPMVRPTLSFDIVKLENKFAYKYQEGATVFYFMTTNEIGESSDFMIDEING